MHIGSIDEMALHHLVYNVVDNSVDEAPAWYRETSCGLDYLQKI